jgi:hypothetical protein
MHDARAAGDVGAAGKPRHYVLNACFRGGLGRGGFRSRFVSFLSIAAPRRLKMPSVSVEMMPIEFPVVDITAPFLLNDEVTFTSPGKTTMEGRVTKVQVKTYGLEQQPGAAVSVAFTDGNMKAFKTGGVAGYTMTKKGQQGTTGKIRKGASVLSFAQLMDARELQVMVNAAEELITRAATIKRSDYVLQWFGQAAFEPKARELIHKRCGDLRDGVAGFSKVVFQCAPAESLGAIDNADPLRGGPTCRIRLGRGFTYDRYSWGERVCTIIHEMTHWVLNTVDVAIDDMPCYGGLCLKLARSTSKAQRELALNNADNWGYYICEYRTAGDGRDWKYFTEKEIESRGPFVPNGYNLVPSVMAFH